MAHKSVLIGMLMATAVAGGCGSSHHANPVGKATATGSSLSVTPSIGGKHDPVRVTFTSSHATGVFGKTRRAYTVQAHSVQPAVGCVNDRDRRFPDRPAGAGLATSLDPANGEGGPAGWCPGLHQGTITYSEAYACPSAGPCRPPAGTTADERVVTRFSFRIR